MLEECKLVIEGETPSKKNSKIRTRSGYMIPSAQHQKWHQDAMLQLNSQLCRMRKPPNMIDTPVNIALVFFHGDNVRRDSDNQASSIMDLLQDAKILADDRWQIVRILNIYNHYDKGHARCEIYIQELETTIETKGKNA